MAFFVGWIHRRCTVAGVARIGFRHYTEVPGEEGKNGQHRKMVFHVSQLKGGAATAPAHHLSPSS
jgi:hypothetical protein